MISRIGNRKGLTFIEVMVTAVVLSVGLVAIYRAFFIALDHMRYLSVRLYANNLIETRIARIEQDLQELKDFDIGTMAEQGNVAGRQVVFHYTIDLKPVGTLLSVFELDVQLSWEEKDREVSISRSAYFSGVTPIKTGKGA